MEILNLIWFFPYISRIHTAYIGVSYLHFRYLKCLVILGHPRFPFQIFTLSDNLCITKGSGPTRVSMKVIIRIVSKLVDFTYLGNLYELPTYLYRSYNPVTKYHGHPSRVQIVRIAVAVWQAFRWRITISIEEVAIWWLWEWCETLPLGELDFICPGTANTIKNKRLSPKTMFLRRKFLIIQNWKQLFYFDSLWLPGFGFLYSAMVPISAAKWLQICIIDANYHGFEHGVSSKNKLHPIAW